MIILLTLLALSSARADWMDHWEKVPGSALPDRVPDGDRNAFIQAYREQARLCDQQSHGRITQCGSEGAGPALDCDIETIHALEELLTYKKTWKAFYASARKNFDWYRYKESVLFTAYNSPTFEASFHETKKFAFPLYAPPKDLAPKKYDRKAIEIDGALKGKGLEIAWLSSPADILRLQIEGSGVLRIDGKNVSVNYAAKNGFPYVSIFKTLKGEVPATFPALREFARKKPRRFREALAESPSYVFFRLADEPACGTSRAHVTGGFSLAVDPTQMPLGLPVFLTAERPKEGTAPDAKEVPLKPFTRFAFAQDTGGAIKGAHVDIYFGSGPYAMLASNSLRSHGQLFFPRAKKELPSTR